MLTSPSNGCVGEALREAAMAIYETLTTHLRREEATLERALREQGPEGIRIADRLSHEHREQRGLLASSITCASI